MGVIHLLDTHPDWPIDSIIAITFTEKAAREMRTRIRKAVEERALTSPQDSAWQEYRSSLDKLQVSTIHSLCARILRENAIAAEIDPRFGVLDEQEADLLKEEAVRETIRVLEEEDHPALELLVSLRVFDLREEMANMLDKRGTLHQIFPELEEPENLLVKWERGLAEMGGFLWETQLREKPGIQAAITSVQNTHISDPGDLLAGSVTIAQKGCLALSENDLTNAANAWLQIGLKGGRQASWGGKESLSRLKEDLKLLRSAAQVLEKAGALKEISLEDQTAARHLQIWRLLWERLELTYSQLKDEQQSMDFDDLEIYTDRLLIKTPRSLRLENYISNINSLMVDEFQDTNQIQQRIVYALAPPEDTGKLLVVGDSKQSIYRFRQAQVGIFNQTKNYIRRVTNEPPVQLDTSFRAHKDLVSAFNNLFEQIMAPMGDTFSEFEAQPGSLRSDREPSPELPSAVEVLVIPEKNDQDEKISAEEARIWEAGWIAQRLMDLKQTRFPVWDRSLNEGNGDYRLFEFRDAAVLFRATTNFPLYEAEFKRAGLPYLTISGRGYYDRQEVQDLIALLAALANPSDDLNLAAALRSPLFSINDETLYRLRWHTPGGGIADVPIKYKKALAEPPPTSQEGLVERAHMILSGLWSQTGRVDIWTLLRRALDETGYETTLARNDEETGRQRANVAKFLSFARERGGISISEFLRRIQDLQLREAREGEALGREPESGAVQLMSIHAAKGLEFPVVVVADLGRRRRSGFGSPHLLHDPIFGAVCKIRDQYGDWQKPAGYAWGEWLEERMEEAERKRLLYVACTRSADLLLLSGQMGNNDTWMAEILDAWGIDGAGMENEELSLDGFNILIHRPGEPGETLEKVEITLSEKAVRLDTIPELAQPLHLEAQPLTVAVSDIERLFSPDEEEILEIRPAVWSGQRSEKALRAPGYKIGNIVHKALAHWGCLEYPENKMFEYLESAAKREGVFPDAVTHAVRTSFWMLNNLKKHQLYLEISDSKLKYHELPFTLNSPEGILHGVIDLLYEDQYGNWHLVDWKTEWTPKEKIEENSNFHLQQISIYAYVSRKQIGLIPSAGICFLSPILYQYRYDQTVIENSMNQLFL